MDLTDTQNEVTFEELCDMVRPIALKYGIEHIYLFGSRAGG